MKTTDELIAEANALSAKIDAEQERPAAMIVEWEALVAEVTARKGADWMMDHCVCPQFW